MSSSKAEGIVTAELRARRLQPDRPIHRPTDSLLSWTKQGPVDTKGLVNWAGMLLCLCGARLALENLLTYGLRTKVDRWGWNPNVTERHAFPTTTCLRARVSATSWVAFLLGDPSQPHHYPVIYPLVALHLPLLLALGLELTVAKAFIGPAIGFILHCLNLGLLLLLPVIFVNLLHFGLVSAVLVTSLYSIIFLKLVSFIQVNAWCRSPNSRRLVSEKSCVTRSELKKDDSDEESKGQKSLLKYPDNLTVGNLYYFCLAPTLCYELNYPRTCRIRKFFLMRRICEVIFLTHFIMALTQQWIVPNLVNSLVPFSETDLPLATERLIRLAMPNHIIWLLGGYLLFHSCLNISGELLFFADRDFYHDWWNSPNFSKFWQNWNLPVHRWFLRHLYKPLLAAGWSRGAAITMVFLVSSFFHEYTVSVPLRMLKPWLFVGFMCNAPLVQLSEWLEERFGPRAGNLSMWLFLVVGQPLLVMTYYHDYVVEHHGPALIAHYGHLNSAAL